MERSIYPSRSKSCGESGAFLSPQAARSSCLPPQAIFRGREKGESVEWSKKELALAAGGVAALVASAYFTVLATENIVAGLGTPKVVGGLFTTTPMAALPEVFATWSVVRSGQVVTSVIGDHTVTLTLSFVLLALVTMPLQNLPLFIINLSGVALVGLLYAAFIWWGGGGEHLRRSETKKMKHPVRTISLEVLIKTSMFNLPGKQ